MSHIAVTWARKVKAGSPTRKFVLIALAEYADEDGSCYPSQKTIANLTELSVKTVERAIKNLEDQGLLKRERRHRTSDGSRTSDRFYLNVRVSVRLEPLTDTLSEPNRQTVGACKGNPLLEPSVKPSETRASALPLFSPKAFNQWWKKYPHKIGKAAAFKSFERIRKAGKVSFKTLLDGLDAYIRDKPIDRPWCNPATWLNQGRWDDDPAPPIPIRRGKVGWGETAKEMIDDITRREEEGDHSDGLISNEQLTIAATKRH